MLTTVSKPAIYSERLPLRLPHVRRNPISSPRAELLRLSIFNAEGEARV